MTGRVAVVTGAARGIGSAAVSRLAADGFHIVAADLPGAPFEDLGVPDDVGLLTVEADVSAEDDWRRIVDETLDRFGRLDALFNNAGIEGPFAPTRSYDVDDFDRVMAVNVRGTFLGIKHSAAVMEPGSSIVNNASIVGYKGAPNIIGYSTSKHAVIGITRTAAREFAPDIRVNAVCPSPTSTRMMWRVQELTAPETERDDFERRFAADNPFGRFATPDEIADVVAFLAGPRSTYVNGAILPVDGGLTA